MTRLSIVIAARNEERYLPEQLKAIHRQHIKPDEIVMVDDGSTDQTVEIIEAFRHILPMIRVIRLPENIGCAEATNRGVSESTGEYLYIASANDVIQPCALVSIADAIRDYPWADLIVGDVAGIHLGWGDEGGHTHDPSYIGQNRACHIFGPSGIIHAAGAVISRNAWDKHGGWDASFFPYSETLTWHVTAARYGLVYTPNDIGWVRQHEGSASTTVLDHEYRRPLMVKAADYIETLEESARTRLITSRLWDIAEWAPEMRELLIERLKARGYPHDSIVNEHEVYRISHGMI